MQGFCGQRELGKARLEQVWSMTFETCDVLPGQIGVPTRPMRARHPEVPRDVILMIVVQQVWEVGRRSRSVGWSIDEQERLARREGCPITSCPAYRPCFSGRRDVVYERQRGAPVGPSRSQAIRVQVQTPSWGGLAGPYRASVWWRAVLCTSTT